MTGYSRPKRAASNIIEPLPHNFFRAGELRNFAVFGDWAYLRNLLTITMTPAGGEAMLRRSGYTLSILRKEMDGRWLLVRDANLLALHD